MERCRHCMFPALTDQPFLFGLGFVGLCQHCKMELADEKESLVSAKSVPMRIHAGGDIGFLPDFCLVLVRQCFSLLFSNFLMTRASRQVDTPVPEGEAFMHSCARSAFGCVCCGECCEASPVSSLAPKERCESSCQARVARTIEHYS